MVNYSKLYSLDEESIQIVDSLPKSKRSEFVRESIKLNHNKKINKPEIVEIEPTQSSFRLKRVIK